MLEPKGPTRLQDFYRSATQDVQLVAAPYDPWVGWGGVDPLEWRNCALHTNARACVVKRAWSWMVVVAVDSDASYQDEDESEDEDDDEDDDAHLDP